MAEAGGLGDFDVWHANWPPVVPLQCGWSPEQCGEALGATRPVDTFPAFTTARRSEMPFRLIKSGVNFLARWAGYVPISEMEACLLYTSPSPRD